MNGASPIPAIIADEAARAAWIAWRVRLHTKRCRAAARASFRSIRGVVTAPCLRAGTAPRPLIYRSPWEDSQ